MPYRYVTNMLNRVPQAYVAAAFQFLIGTLQTKATDYILGIQFEFQFLIGRYKPV